MKNRDELEAILRAAPSLMAVMETAATLELPDWLIFSGAIYQRVLNHLTGRDPDHGIKDYDLAYFDPDTSWDAEDAVIARVAAAFQPPVREMVEVRNQARVHLWFEAKFGESYAPLSSSAQALTRFASPLNAVAARLEADGAMTIVAPFGLGDLFSLTYRENPNRRVSGFARTAEAARSRWPELTIIPQA
ncbi:nucleotidyltransferase family protein [Phenylobacterium sp.]|uniref:nucleotidyltransferase family protein n=1 Tax=Phenylobacterium sp. TaxID=1871053 RepID=UPI0035287933